MASPGTAKTSLPCSSANPAVISEPLPTAPSTTTVPKLNAEIILFLTGKCRPSAGDSGGYSVITAPFLIISWRSSLIPSRYFAKKPHPSTATVTPFSDSAPKCDAPSIPIAPPLITATPARTSDEAILAAISIPCLDALRVPTKAIAILSFKQLISPST
ncbi:hypothetical protein SDC9_130220 [bioreactor metagenome]|uniref:Uncharacterized protein n=1 Tax=bioreactor metagenome TaxID=1076179 RepID=A0A645D1Q5_9ZZZZ